MFWLLCDPIYLLLMVMAFYHMFPELLENLNNNKMGFLLTISFNDIVENLKLILIAKFINFICDLEPINDEF